MLTSYHLHTLLIRLLLISSCVSRVNVIKIYKESTNIFSEDFFTQTRHSNESLTYTKLKNTLSFDDISMHSLTLNFSACGDEHKQKYPLPNLRTIITKQTTVSQAIARGVKEVAEVYFVHRKLEFDIITIGDVPAKFFDIIDDMQAGWKHQEVPRLIQKSQYQIIFNRSALIFIQQDMLYSFFDQAFFSVRSYRSEKFLIYSEVEITREMFIEDLTKASGHIEQFTYFVKYIPELGLALMTPTWFEKDCKLILKIINLFNMYTLTWNEKLIAFDKYANMNQCPVTIFADCIPKTFKESQLYPAGNTRRDNGYICGNDVMMEKVGEKNNFTGVFLNLYAFTSDIGLRYDFLFETDASFFQPFTNHEFKVLIPPSDAYNSYEKLILPFDFTTWILTLVTFGIAYNIVAVVNNTSRAIQDLLYGEGVTTPGYNVTAIFFGISQVRLPNGNFARIILVSFIYFCLVMRTAYQGVFYEMMTTDMRKPRPKTIQDLIDQNYTIITSEIMYPETLQSKFENRSSGTLEFYNSDNFRVILKSACDLLQGKSEKTSIHVHSLHELYITEYCHMIPLALEEIVLETTMVTVVEVNHPLYFAISDVLNHCIEAGIYPFWPKYLSPWLDEESSEPQILTVEGLSFGFIIFLGACGISILVFFYELLVRRLMPRKHTKKQVKAKTAKVDPLNIQNKAVNVKSTKVPKISRVKRDVKPRKTNKER